MLKNRFFRISISRYQSLQFTMSSKDAIELLFPLLLEAESRPQWLPQPASAQPLPLLSALTPACPLAACTAEWPPHTWMSCCRGRGWSCTPLQSRTQMLNMEIITWYQKFIPSTLYLSIQTHRFPCTCHTSRKIISIPAQEQSASHPQWHWSRGRWR